MDESIWQKIKINNNNKTIKDTTDILIIGAGLTGIMCAYMLSKENKDITLIDRSSIGNGVTAKTSAKITPIHNLMYQDIKRIHGINKAKLYFNSQVEGMKEILSIIKKENIDCDLKKVNNYIYAKTDQGLKKLEKEYKILSEMNVDIKLINNIPEIKDIKKALYYNENYIFHPLKYISKIVDVLKNRNIAIYDNMTALSYEKKDDYYIVNFSNNRIIKTNKIIVASHYPIFNFENLYFTKLYQEKNYLIAFETKKKINNIYINTDPKVRSLRSYDENTIIIIGNSHKTGDKHRSNKELNDLRNSVYELDKNAKIKYTWTNQDVLSIDFLPYIGKYFKRTENIYIATAFHTWGMTNSHIAAKILTDLIMNKNNNYEKLYNPNRVTHLKSPVEALKLIRKAVNGLILSRLKIFPKELKYVPYNQGKIICHKGKHYAVYNKDGECITLRANCTHTSCFLHFNDNEKTWDCKCHGSRFDIYGSVVQGPAVKPLKRVFFR